jgi:hypothetical protein
MNKIVLFFLLCFSVSAFANDEYYVWSDGQTATNALTFINDNGWFPVVGRNKKNGKKETRKSSATCWTDKVLIRKDGKFCFKRVSSDLLDALKISTDQRTKFLETFNPVIETYNESWFQETTVNQ